MKSALRIFGLALRAFPAILAGLAAAGCGQFAHVPPGQSVEVALARQPEVIRMGAVEPTAGTDTDQPAYTGPAVEPELPSIDLTDVPSQDIVVEDVSSYVARGDALMQDGKTAEAIDAYLAATQVDPTFSIAWRNLALAYQNAGDTPKAMDAFRHYKTFAAQ